MDDFNLQKQIAYGTFTIKNVDEGKREFVGIASTPEPDRANDIMVPEGAKFKLPMPFLWQHDHLKPVGEIYEAKVTNRGIEVKGRIKQVSAPSQLAARLDEAWVSIREGLVRGLSIGFRGIRYSFLDDGGVQFDEWDWYELSAVTIPMNAQGTITQVKSVDAQIRAALGNPSVEAPADVKKSGVSEQYVKIKTKEKEMDISTKIKGFQDELEAKKATMDALVNKSVEEGRTFDEAEGEEFATLQAETEALEKHINLMKSTVERAKATATPVTGDTEAKALQARSPAIAVKAKQKSEPGIEFARFGMCLVAAKNNVSVARNIAKANYGEDAFATRVLSAQADYGLDFSKAAVPAGTTTDATWAAPLIDEYRLFAQDFIDYLRPRTIIGQFGVDGRPSLYRVPFNIRIPAQTSGATANWSGEGAAKPVTKMDFADVELRWAKIAAISVITDELVRFSDPSAERLVRDELAKAVIERMDIDFVNPAKAAVTNVSPASITNGVTPIPATGTGTAEDIRCDVTNLFAGFDAANNPANEATFIMSTTTARALSMLQNPLGQSEYPGLTARGGTFLGYPVIVSNYVPADSTGQTVILVNASDIMIADDGVVTLDASREASIQMDDAPSHNSGTPAPAQVVSMFQTNSVALRAERYVNWGKRRASAVQVLSGVNWGQCA